MRDKVIVVTGGCRGIGRSIALACAAQGAKVAALARTPVDIERMAKELGPAHLALRCDVTRSGAIADAYASIENKLGPIYGLVCAAGIYGNIGAFAETPFEEWERAIQINLLGCARSVHAALPGMLKQGGGRVVLFSGGGQGAMANFSSYVTSKGAIWRLNETLAAELAPKNIFVNAIAPGAVNTSMLDELLKAGREKVGDALYEKSMQQKNKGGEDPEKAAQLCLYLLSDRSQGLYGKIISAIWDDYEGWTDLPGLSKSERFTPRRVT